jgi:hypothetical protein
MEAPWQSKRVNVPNARSGNISQIAIPYLENILIFSDSVLHTPPDLHYHDIYIGGLEKELFPLSSF